MEYGALGAKVRAMYGKRLRRADFAHMGSLSEAADVLEYLRAQPGWAQALAHLSAGYDYVGRVELEDALSRQVRRDYEALSHFIPKGDETIVAFPVRTKELEEIMRALRRLKSGEGAAVLPPPITVLKVDYKALRACTDYQGVLQASRESIYYNALRHLKPESGGLPDYATAEALLQSAYYAHLYRTVHKHYAGATQSLLLRSFGTQVDLMNLIHLLRIKVYFSGEVAISDLLFPFQYKLKGERLKTMCAAASVEEVFTLLEGTPYAGELGELPHTPAAVEAYYRRAFYRLNKRQLSAGEPSVYTAISYLNLKQLEYQALVNLVESVKYHVPYDDTFANMVGD